MKTAKKSPSCYGNDDDQIEEIDARWSRQEEWGVDDGKRGVRGQGQDSCQPRQQRAKEEADVEI